jgi:hypothetical protein
LFISPWDAGRELIDAIHVDAIRTGQEPFAWWEGAFNEQQLNWLQQQARNWQQKAAVGGGGVGGVEIPTLDAPALTGCPTHNETQWVFETLGHVISSFNAQFFGFDLTRVW